ncbi:uncharacterized protein LOC142018498 [Carettochelys insculpta]|uniref:uncharacterized protein LOC142018498 n=1 Tax=Carettochelys insculpta TaxID=44489 RepID=UPI003EBF97CE
MGVTRRIASAFGHLAHGLQTRGHTERTAEQVLSKVKELQQGCTQARDQTGHSGAAPATCPFFRELRGILGPKDSSPPPSFLDTSAEELQPEEEEQPGSGTQEGEGITEWLSEERGAHHRPPFLLLQPGDRGLDIPGCCRGTFCCIICGLGEPCAVPRPRELHAALGGTGMPPRTAHRQGHGQRAPRQAEENPASQQQAEVAKQHLWLA